jgi:hypothetical protein
VDLSSYDDHCTACLYNGGSFCSTEDDSDALTYTYVLGYGFCSDDVDDCGDEFATDYTQCGYVEPANDDDGEEDDDDATVDDDDATVDDDDATVDDDDDDEEETDDVTGVDGDDDEEIDEEEEEVEDLECGSEISIDSTDFTQAVINVDVQEVCQIKFTSALTENLASVGFLGHTDQENVVIYIGDVDFSTVIQTPTEQAQLDSDAQLAVDPSIYVQLVNVGDDDQTISVQYGSGMLTQLSIFVTMMVSFMLI